tara:strand:- start:2733 stop:3158 length:426 start_codon:yes stop_codon:yes gene_type:complete
MPPAEFIEARDGVGLAIATIFLFISGGALAAVVNAISASRRGVKGDALQKEVNAVAGFDSLTAALQKDHARISGENAELRERLDKLETSTFAQIESLKREILHWREEAEWAVEYSNILIRTLHENTIEIPPRPARKKREGN